MTCNAAMVTSLPPGPTAGPALQTMRWLMRPIAFLEACRRRYGDAFSVRFLGFETPLVMVSKPEVLGALYSESGHGLPPGRTLSLRPITGPRSVLLLDGVEHLSRRRVMLPPFHGDRMRAYEPIVREAAEREIARWPIDRPFAAHPSMQAVTLEVILRAVFGVADAGRRARLREGLVDLLGSTASAGLQLSVLLSRRLGGPDPLERLHALMADIDEILLAEIAERRADGEDGDGAPARDDICSLLVAARFEDGGRMGDREIRDQLMTLLLAGHETTATALAWTLDLLTCHPDVLARLARESTATTTPTCAPSSRSPCACGRWSRWPVVGLQASCARAGWSFQPAPMSPRPSGWHTPARTPIPSPMRSAPSVSWTVRPPPTRGSRSAAVCAAA